MPFIKSLKIYRSVTGLAFSQMWKQPRLLTPFFYLALLNFAGLAIIYYSPQWPFSLALAKPIRAFYSESALHYPYNLAYLPEIFRGWRMFAEILFASILTGTTISMYNQFSKNMSLRFGKNFRIAFNRYLALVLFTLLVVIPPYLLNRFLVYFVAERMRENSGFFLHMGRLKWMITLGGTNLLANLSLMTLFVYVPVAIIVENMGFRQACRESIKKTGRYLLVTLLITMVPTIIAVLMESLTMIIPKLMDTFMPEISLMIVGLGIVVAFAVNLVIAISSAILYLNTKDVPARKGRVSA